MSVHFTGPILNVEKNKGDREWFSKLPIGMEPDYIQYYNDFLSDKDYDTTNKWAEVKDSGAAVAIVDDALNGEIALTSTATTDDDGASIQTTEENWKLESAKKLWFETKIKIADVDQVDAFVGLITNFATNPEAALTTADRVGFQINDGDEDIVCKSEKDGTEESTSSGKDMVNATYVKLGFYWDGVDTVKFFVDRSLVASHSATYPDDENLAIGFSQISGVATGTQSMTVDYVWVVKQR